MERHVYGGELECLVNLVEQMIGLGSKGIFIAKDDGILVSVRDGVFAISSKKIGFFIV
jgi:hypothetical protein